MPKISVRAIKPADEQWDYERGREFYEAWREMLVTGITAIRAHRVRVEAGLHTEYLEARHLGAWCPVCRLTSQIFTRGQWCNLITGDS